MKRFLSLFFAVYSILILTPTSLAAEHSYAWCVKRGRNGSTPIIEETAKRLLNEYNAYYVDPSVNEKDKVLYLTFDVGYENESLVKVLDVLKKEKISAAFFVLSHVVKNDSDFLSRLQTEGHLICNHTSKHPDLTKKGEDKIKEEIKMLEEQYQNVSEKKIAPFFRPPEGKYNEKVLATAQNLGYTTVFWSLAYADWNDEVAPNDEKAMKILKENTHNGAIILLHPTSEINARILGEMIAHWKKEGYRFGMLNELKQR